MDLNLTDSADKVNFRAIASHQTTETYNSPDLSTSTSKMHLGAETFSLRSVYFRHDGHT